VLSAVVARICFAACHAMMTTFDVATLLAVAGGDATGPTGVEDMIQAGIIIGEFVVEVRDGVFLIAGYRIGLLTLHSKNNIISCPTCCQGIK